MSNAVNETTVAARIPVSLRQQLEELARNDDRSLSYEIRRGLQRHVEAVGGFTSSPVRNPGERRTGGGSGSRRAATRGECVVRYVAVRSFVNPLNGRPILAGDTFAVRDADVPGSFAQEPGR